MSFTYVHNIMAVNRNDLTILRYVYLAPQSRHVVLGVQPHHTEAARRSPSAKIEKRSVYNLIYRSLSCHWMRLGIQKILLRMKLPGLDDKLLSSCTLSLQ